MRNLHAAAQAYAAKLRWPVFPCRGKKPIPTHGFKEATTDLRQIDQWWCENPTANVAIPTGPASGYDVLDIDPKHGGEKSLAALEAEHGPLPKTVCLQTGSGGRHFYFRHRSGVRNREGMLPGIDVRGDGGYAIVSPSRHPDTGNPYDWVYGCRPDQIEAADWPEWLLDLVRKPVRRDIQPIPLSESETFSGTNSPYGDAALRGEVKRVRQAQPGCQESTLNTASFSLGTLVGGGHLDSQLARDNLVAAGMQMLNETGKPPWTEAQIAEKVDRGLRDGMLHPREMPELGAETKIKRVPDPILTDHTQHEAKTGNVSRGVEDVLEGVASSPKNGQPQKREGVFPSVAGLVDHAGLTPDALNGTSVDHVMEWLRCLANLVKETDADPLLQAGVRAEAVRRLKAAKVADSPARLVDAALGGVGVQEQDGGGQGQTLVLSEPEPWSQPVEGAALLDEIEQVFKRYVILPDGGATACSLWMVFAYCHDAFYTSPILSITSPTKRCGKTTALGVLLSLLPRAVPSSSITPASLFRAIDKYSPSLVIDEGDTWLATGNEELRGILNSGHTKNMAYVVRCEGEDHEPRPFSTWAPKVLALIGTLPDTLQDRSINITMRRKMPGERVERLRLDQGEEFEELRRRAARWAQDNLPHLRQDDPEIPDGLNDRAADSWRPLLAIADAAGGAWPKKASTAATTLSGGGVEQEDGSPGVLLLQDMKGLFASPQTVWLASQVITTALAEKEDRPWPEWKQGQPITPRQLARLLDPFGIKPKQRKDGGRVIRGYGREDFEEAWMRYIPQNPPSDPLPSATSMGDNDLQEKNIRYQAGSVADTEAPQVVEKHNGSGGSGYEPPAGGEMVEIEL